ncbi:hypothetical protein THAOC_34273 [Thalassiosira oceanica]|uniref:FH2 domain-containing protein n=1 Tax=Thalassiosira oceanica TaxID=159749 RepID=K0RD64_THAOC|nr:hypothetical protein THAOC_34273 [Thalassiosira oceanica]|eukprot:EJK47036.1 hypothetical protein THAOC_34273 [Thalassiosira oceanica]
MVDRQQALRNYHARKMAGRQQGPQPTPALAPSSGGGPKIELSNEQKRRQRSLIIGNKAAATVSSSANSSRNTDRTARAAVLADSNVKENLKPKPNLFVNTNQEYANPRSTKLTATSGPSSSSSATSNASRMTAQQKAAFVASRRKQSAAITTNANPSNNRAPSVTDAPNQSSSTAPGDNKLMKEMFAARRRRAQVEMSQPTKPRDSIGSVSTMNTAETAGTSVTLSTADSRPSAVPNAPGRSEAASGKKSAGTSRSRRALEMYLGKTSKQQPSHEGGGSSVVSGSSCEKSLGTTTLSTRDSLNLCGSESMDSLDNRTVGSTTSTRGILPVVREESSASLVSGKTVRLDNTSRSQKLSAKDEDVLRVNAELKDCTSAMSSVRIEDGSTAQKSVRFHLSPLERLKKKKAQCSPPRAATQSYETGCEELTSVEQVVEEEEEDDEQFVMFMTGIRSELARDHTELWSGFQTLLGRPPSSHVPLASPAEEAIVEQVVVDKNGKKKLKKKKRKTAAMDSKAQSSLNRIHRHFMEDGRVKARFMTNTGQLVNDKQVRKDRAANATTENRSWSSTPSRSSPPSEMSCAKVDLKPKLHVSPSRDNLRPARSVTQQRDEDKEQPSWAKSYREKKSSALMKLSSKKKSKDPSVVNAPSDDDAERSVATSATTPISSVNLRSISRVGSKGSSNASVSSNGSGHTNDSTKQKLSWMEALKKKQRSLRSKQQELEQSDSVDSDVASSSISGVVLRCVSPRKKRKTTPPSTPDVQLSPWAGLQLRTTPNKRESMAPSLHSNQNASSTLQTHTPTSALAHESSTASSSSSLLPPLCCVGDVINLDKLPDKVFPDGKATIFELEDLRGNGERKSYVIVGNIAICTASSEDGGRKASISWQARRTSIRALTLNNEATGATLAHSEGRRPLQFQSADACLDFAQAFYRGVDKSAEDGGRSQDVNSSGPSCDPDIEQGGTSEKSTAPASSLTEDEESLLDRYRKFSESDRNKLRLTVKSPRGGMEEVEVSLTPKANKPSLEASATCAEDNQQAELSEEEETIASKYRKMLKMGIPSDAVRHKMTSDGIAANITSSVCDEGARTANKSITKDDLSSDEEAIAAKYRRMLKMGVPPDGVKHKMASDGIDSKIVQAVFAPPGAEQKPAAPVKNKLSEQDEVIATKYRKMLKMGIPLDGVRHKMTQDGVDMKIVSVIVSEADPSAKFEDESVAKAAPKKSAPKEPLLSDEDETIASKYRNMLKVCIPKDAVRHKMTQEGVSDKIIDAVLGKENGPSKDAKTPAKSSSKTVRLHWETRNLAPEQFKKSIFAKTEKKKRKLQSINPEEDDIRKLEEIFQKKNSIASKTKNIKAEVDSSMAKLLDLTRANNIAISLKAFNDFTFRSLAETINDLDPDTKIVGERVHFIPNLLPTPKEIAAVKKYKGDDDKLITAELFFRQLISIKRIEDKVQVMRTMSTFEEQAEEVRAGFKTMQQVCAQVMNSEKLIQILELILNVGNLMNEGTLDGGVEAFRFDSLPKLSQTKSADGKTTVLDYIIKMVIEKGERDTLFLTDEFPDMQESCRLSINDLKSDLNTLRNDYKLCKAELSSLKRDQSSKKKSASSLPKKAKDQGEAGPDPRKALFAAIKSRGSQADAKPKAPPDPRQALFAAIKSKKDNTNAQEESIESNITYTPGVGKLQSFVDHSKSVLSFTEQDQDAAVRACKVSSPLCGNKVSIFSFLHASKGLAIYCGEEGGEGSVSTLLQVLSDFAASLENGVKKYDERIERERRAKKKQQDKMPRKNKEKENEPNGPPKSTRQMLKASSLQPHVGLMKNSPRRDAKNELLNAIKDQGTERKTRPSSAQENPRQAPLRRDAKNELLDAIKDRGTEMTGTERKTRPSSAQENPRQALLDSIKRRRDSLPAKPPPDGVNDRVKHINTNLERQESRILLTHRMLNEAPESVRQDFVKGVVYTETKDPLLRKIYESEGDTPHVGGTKSEVVDPRLELLAAIRKQRK